jgi:hypothetical protein
VAKLSLLASFLATLLSFATPLGLIIMSSDSIYWPEVGVLASPALVTVSVALLSWKWYRDDIYRGI